MYALIKQKVMTIRAWSYKNNKTKQQNMMPVGYEFSANKENSLLCLGKCVQCVRNSIN